MDQQKNAGQTDFTIVAGVICIVSIVGTIASTMV